MRGMQHAGPEWRKLCRELRSEVLKVSPLSNRRFTNTPGTYRRMEVAQQTGVNLAILRRFLDDNLPVLPDTALAVGRWLGFELQWVWTGRAKSLPLAMPPVRRWGKRPGPHAAKRGALARRRAAARGRA